MRVKRIVIMYVVGITAAIAFGMWAVRHSCNAAIFPPSECYESEWGTEKTDAE